MTTQALRSIQRIGIAMLAILSLLAAMPATVHGASATYEYDIKGRVSKITYNDGTVIDYTYDLNGNRTGATTTTPPPDTTAPTAPGTPTFSSVTMTSATVSWTAATDNKGVVGYDYKVNAGAWQSLTNVLSVNLTSLTPWTSYTVQVCARDAATNIGTASSNSFTTPDTVPPTVPTGLSGSAPNSTTVNLTDSGGSGLAGYRIYRGGSPLTTTSSTSYSDTSVSGGTSYSYNVTAYDNATNESLQSNTASATTLPAVTVSVSSGNWRWRRFNTKPTQVDPPVVCSATGGTGAGYTFHWVYASGDTLISANSPNSNTTIWSRSIPFETATYTAIWACVVTDSAGNTGTNSVQVTFIRTVPI